MINNIKIKKKYWDNFYQKKKLIFKNTNFSKFCAKFLKNYQHLIIDIGCGNGRDTNFFLQKKFVCFGVDQSKKVITINKKKYVKFKKYFLNKDFSKINFDIYFKKKYSIYSRFSLHSINYKSELSFFNNLLKSKNLEYLMIETRTIYDDLYGKGEKVGNHEYVTDHYRRFIEPAVLKKKLKKFKIIYFNINKNLAKFKNENPKVLRVIYKNVR